MSSLEFILTIYNVFLQNLAAVPHPDSDFDSWTGFFCCVLFFQSKFHFPFLFVDDSDIFVVSTTLFVQSDQCSLRVLCIMVSIAAIVRRKISGSTLRESDSLTIRMDAVYYSDRRCNISGVNRNLFIK